ncbi:SIS domain-containing protein [Asanoa sp. WMMD1127]|uniref:SIS domain-containing protein n=1 Tax=Asanoa sp. WMMD1127 TaxID=3016107 RepID=UPI0024170B00|nr:SIS domain-containing protein [Asanoa sp. WMMD1127]MDG4822490.1 SIS domain-containing protein [Asanoa sp. WMMD1127]
MTHVEAEIASQPSTWAQVADLGVEGLPRRGQRVAVVGCGTSWFMAMAYAARRESLGHGETDAFQASEFPRNRAYDLVVAISRSGTTTEVVDLLGALSSPSLAIVGDPDSPAASAAGTVVALPFADERSVVQTRFATTALALLRSGLGEDTAALAAHARRALDLLVPLDPAAVEQVTFVGQGWTVGLAQEAALKCREAATFWTEAYPAMDYRHGPVSIAAPGRAVWSFGPPPAGLPGEVTATGATFAGGGASLDPMAELILAQRFAVALAAHRGLDPDTPRNLTRSVVLEPR